MILFLEESHFVNSPETRLMIVLNFYSTLNISILELTPSQVMNNYYFWIESNNLNYIITLDFIAKK